MRLSGYPSEAELPKTSRVGDGEVFFGGSTREAGSAAGTQRSLAARKWGEIRYLVIP